MKLETTNCSLSSVGLLSGHSGVVRRSTAMVFAGAAVTALGLVPGAAHAASTTQSTSTVAVAPAGESRATACNQWSIGYSTIIQSNGYQVRVPQQGRYVWGSAYSYDGAGRLAETGQAQGAVTGNSVDFTISWGGGSFGAYRGWVDSDGFTHGESWDKANPWSKATWRLQHRAACVG